MKRNLMPLLIIAVMLASSSRVAWGDQRVVKVAAFHNYPVIFTDKDGVVRGFYVDLLDEIGREENILFEYVPGTWSEGLERVRNGQVDLVTSVAYTEERGEFMDFCRYPLLTVWGEVYTIMSSDIHSIFDVAGKRIALMKGDINGKKFEELTSNFGIGFYRVEYNSYDEVFKAVANGAVAGGVAGVTFGASKQREYNLMSTGVVFNPMNIYFAASKGRNRNLLDILDRYLDEWRHGDISVYSQSKEKWFHGSVGAIAVTPAWFGTFLLVMGTVIIIAIIFILMLRVRVKSATHEIRQREQALCKSEEILTYYIENSPLGVIEWDSDFKIKRWTGDSERIFGWTSDEAIGKYLNEMSMVFVEDLPLVDDVLKKMTDGKHRHVISSNRNYRRDGSIINCVWYNTVIEDESGRMSSVFSQILDVTGSVKTEEMLREKEEIFSQFMLHSPIYVFFKDSELRAIRLSANFRQLTGKPVDELLGRAMHEMFPPEFAQKILEDDMSVMRKNQVTTLDEELNGRFYTTYKFPFAVSGKQYLAGFTIDITERKQFEEKIQALLGEKDLLLKEVHHRIKNNMNTIKGLLTLQLSAEEADSPAAASLRDAESRVQSMIMLYDRLYCTDNYRELPVKDYLQSMTEEIIQNFPKRNIVTVKTEIEDFILNLNILTPVAIIINELLTNIMKYAFIDRESGIITVSASMKNNHAVVKVHDNGRGIPEGINFGASTGFGLNLAGMLAEQIEGKIRIDRGQGTTVVLEFDVQHG